MPQSLSLKFTESVISIYVVFLSQKLLVLSYQSIVSSHNRTVNLLMYSTLQGKTSEALTKLLSLQALTARLLTDKEWVNFLCEIIIFYCALFREEMISVELVQKGDKIKVWISLHMHMYKILMGRILGRILMTLILCILLCFYKFNQYILPIIFSLQNLALQGGIVCINWNV